MESWAVLAVMVGAVAGCGNDDDSRPAPPPAATSDEQLQSLCADESVSYAGSPPYVGAGPHPIRFYMESPTSDDFAPASAPLAVLDAPSPGSAQLAGCARRDGETELIRSCGPYTAPPTLESPINIAGRVPAYRVSYEIKVYEISTRRLVDTVTITSRRTYQCPERIGPHGNGGIVVENGIQPYVERNGSPVLEVEVTEPEAGAALESLINGPAG